jgi:hypothetical protein
MRAFKFFMTLPGVLPPRVSSTVHLIIGFTTNWWGCEAMLTGGSLALVERPVADPDIAAEPPDVYVGGRWAKSEEGTAGREELPVVVDAKWLQGVPLKDWYKDRWCAGSNDAIACSSHCIASSMSGPCTSCLKATWGLIWIVLEAGGPKWIISTPKMVDLSQ